MSAYHELKEEDDADSELQHMAYVIRRKHIAHMLKDVSTCLPADICTLIEEYSRTTYLLYCCVSQQPEDELMSPAVAALKKVVKQLREQFGVRPVTKANQRKPQRYRKQQQLQLWYHDVDASPRQQDDGQTSVILPMGSHVMRTNDMRLMSSNRLVVGREVWFDSRDKYIEILNVENWNTHTHDHSDGGQHARRDVAATASWMWRLLSSLESTEKQLSLQHVPTYLDLPSPFENCWLPKQIGPRVHKLYFGYTVYDDILYELSIKATTISKFRLPSSPFFRQSEGKMTGEVQLRQSWSLKDITLDKIAIMNFVALDEHTLIFLTLSLQNSPSHGPITMYCLHLDTSAATVSAGLLWSVGPPLAGRLCTQITSVNGTLYWQLYEFFRDQHMYSSFCLPDFRRHVPESNHQPICSMTSGPSIRGRLLGSVYL